MRIVLALKWDNPAFLLLLPLAQHLVSARRPISHSGCAVCMRSRSFGLWPEMKPRRYRKDNQEGVTVWSNTITIKVRENNLLTNSVGG